MSARKKSAKKNLEKKIARLSPSRQTAVLFLVGLSLVFLSLVYFNHRSRRLSFERFPTGNINQTIELQIVRLNVTLPVEQGKIISGTWQISEKGASYLVNSARPSQKGSIIIYGHNSQKILGPLRKAEIGDIINIKTRSGVIHSYRVKNILYVSPKAVQILEDSGEETLIVYTCAGFADTKRLVVKAIPL